MIEQILLEYLESMLDVPVFLEKPREKTDSYITIERTGGSTEEHVYHSTVVIDSYAPSLTETIELNREVVSAMENIISLDSIGKCELNSNYNDTDSKTKEYRYGALFDLTHY